VIAAALRRVAAVAFGVCVPPSAGVSSPSARESELVSAGSDASWRLGPIATGFPPRVAREVIRLRIAGDSLKVNGIDSLACQVPYDHSGLG
jgi:hypothetical protein